MFCSECGAKNEKDALFCSECGFKFEGEKPKKVTKKSTVIEEDDIEKKKNEPVLKSSELREKKSNIKVIVLIVLAIIIIGGYKLLSNMFSPAEIAKEYIDAVVNNDADKIYDYLEIKGDKTFISKKLFKKIYKDNYKSEINNYSILKTKYGKGNLTASVEFSYTIKDSDEEKNGSVKLTKAKEKKYFVFDTWKINDFKDNSSMIVKNYKISVSKGSKLMFGGIEVSKKYLDKKSSTTTLDVYVLPQVFTIKTEIKATLSNGLVVEKEITPSKWYNSYTVSFDENDLTKKQKNKIVSDAKKIITNLYNSAINGDEFDDIKSSYKHSGVDMDILEKSYNNFLKELKDDYYKLTKFSISDMEIYNLNLNNDGNMEVEFKVTYDYTVEYKSGDETKNRDRTNNSAWMTIVLGSTKDYYYLMKIKTLKTYFY